MKFACDKCNTRYSIADDRVRGRVLKIRCKACNHVITVREEEEAPELPALSAGGEEESTRVSMSPPAGAADATGDDWFVSFDGDQEGPLPLGRALDRVRAERPRGKECYCWRAGFFVWLPVEDVPEFAAALSKAAPPPPVPSPAPPARGATGQMPAVTAAGAGKSPTGPSPIVSAAKAPATAAAPPPKATPAPGPAPALPSLKSPTGSNPRISATGSNPSLSATGSNPRIGGAPPLPAIPAAAKSPTTGPQAAVKSPSGSQPALRSTTGSHGALKDKPAAGSTASLRSAPGAGPEGSRLSAEAPELPSPPGHGEGKSLPDLPPPRFSDLPKALSDLPPLDSGPLGSPMVSMPSLPTKPEPRVARKGDDLPGFAPPAPHAGTGPTLTGPTLVSDAPTAASRPPGINVDPPIPDTGPVPLPPPPDDLPIGEASGLISLNHLVKPSLLTSSPSMTPQKPVIDTFGGVPVIPTPAGSPIIVSTGAARGTPPWMKWAALAGALATLCLAVVVVVLAGRKPTVIVVPPAPNLDDSKKVADKPITINDPGPNPGSGSAPTASGDKNKGGSAKKAPSARAAVSVKPASETLSASQRNLASLYRDDNEHTVPRDTNAADRAGRGGSGQVSQQAIMAVVTQNRRSLNLCYDRVLKHDSSLKSGRVLTHVKIGISGSVTGVSVPDPQYASSEIGQCIAQTIKHWHFPSADSEYETEFPIILQAN